jgi:hypothetical protein
MAAARTRSLPEPNLLGLGTPLAIYKGRLFQASLEGGGENYLTAYGKRYSLDEIARPSELESLYLEHNRQEVEDFQRAFIREFSNREFSSGETVQRMLSRNKTLALIAEKILPVITGQQEESRLTELAGGGRSGRADPERPREEEMPPEMRRELSRVKHELIERVNREYERYRVRLVFPIGEGIGPARDSALYDFTSDAPYLIEGRRVYDLMSLSEIDSLFLSRSLVQTEQRERLRRASSPEEAGRILLENKAGLESRLYSKLSNVVGSMHLRLDGRYYFPVLAGTVEEFSKSYLRFIEKKAKIDAIAQDEEHNMALYKMAEKKKSLEEMASRNEYEQNNAGFKIIEGDYYVFVRTPAYALRSPHTSEAKRYVGFQSAMVGVKLSASGNGFGVEQPVVMNRYSHPFLHSNGSMQRICLGSWGMSNQQGRQAPEDRAVLLLDQGKKTLMMGYGTGNSPYHKLDHNNFSNWLTKEEAENQGLVVLNEVRRR